jgi:hypothetical protein
VDDEGFCEDEGVVMISSTVDVDVLEKLAASAFPGDVEVIRVCGALSLEEL